MMAESPRVVGSVAGGGRKKMWLTWTCKEERVRRIHFGCYSALIISSHYEGARKMARDENREQQKVKSVGKRTISGRSIDYSQRKNIRLGIALWRSLGVNGGGSGTPVSCVVSIIAKAARGRQLHSISFSFISEVAEESRTRLSLSIFHDDHSVCLRLL